MAPSITVVTVSRNSELTIKDTCRSVAYQAHVGIEHLIVDGGSTDNTVSVARAHSSPDARVISEPDKGIYDAMNKGWRLAVGKIIGFLNSDDWYASENILARVEEAFQNETVDIVYSDIELVHPVKPGRIVRKWHAGRYSIAKLRVGWHPPHPGFFARRALFGRLGGFKEELRVAADYELMLRFLRNVRPEGVRYIEDTSVFMRAGGASNAGIKAIWAGYRDCVRAWQMNGWPGGRVAATLKPISKLTQLL